MGKIIIFIVLGLTAVLIGFSLDMTEIHVPDGVDKILHCIGFAGITALFLSIFISIFGKKWINSFIVITLISGGVIAAVTEILQRYTATRETDPLDWLANVSGITIGTLLFYFVILRIESIKNRDE